MSRPVARAACYVIAALLLSVAAAYMIFGRDKSLGVLGVVIAVIACRVLILNLAEDQFAPDDGAHDK